MLREESRSESVLRRSVVDFVAAFRPRGVPSAYELLFIPSDEETPFVPPPDQMRLCLAEWAALVDKIRDRSALAEGAWVEAAELTLTHLVCAGRAGCNLPGRETLQLIVTTTRRLEAELDPSGARSLGDALERISAVADEIVAQGYAQDAADAGACRHTSG